MVSIVIENIKKLTRYFFIFLLVFILSKKVSANPFQPDKGHGTLASVFTLSFLKTIETAEMGKKAYIHQNFFSLYGNYGITDRVSFVFEALASRQALTVQRSFFHYETYSNKYNFNGANALVQVGIIRYNSIIKLSFVFGLGSPIKVYNTDYFAFKRYSVFSAKGISGFELGINVSKNAFFTLETRYISYMKNTFNSVFTSMNFGYYFFEKMLLLMSSINIENCVDHKQRLLKNLSYSKIYYHFLIHLSKNLLFGFNIFTSFKSKVLFINNNFKESGIGFTVILNY